ncbi:MAG: hypothetical protein JJU12_02510 [Chlamydiales bacterium]|nr:hypothetical protein [Chlamydiales bacterium]
MTIPFISQDAYSVEQQPLNLGALLGPDQAEGLSQLSQEERSSLLNALGINNSEEEQPRVERTAGDVNNLAPPQIQASVAEGLIGRLGWPVRERYLLFNHLSMFWTWEAVRQDPRRIGDLAFYYAFGIVGYALALPFRVAVFVKELFHLPYSFFCNLCVDRGENFFQTMKVRLLCFLGASGELVSGIVGLVCPPVAYWIDEKIQDNAIIHANSRIRGIRIEPEHSLSDIVSDLLRDVSPETYRGNDERLRDVSPETYRGNDERRNRKKLLLEPLVPYFHQGMERLKSYYNDDSIISYPVILHLIPLLGFLHSFMNSLKKSADTEFLGEMKGYIREYQPNLDYNQDYLNYKEAWKKLIANYDDSSRLVEYLILRGVQDAVAEEGLCVNDYLQGKEQELISSLKEVSENETFSTLYDSMRKMSAALTNSDGELLSLVNEKFFKD